MLEALIQPEIKKIKKLKKKIKIKKRERERKRNKSPCCLSHQLCLPVQTPSTEPKGTAASREQTATAKAQASASPAQTSAGPKECPGSWHTGKLWRRGQRQPTLQSLRLQRPADATVGRPPDRGLSPQRLHLLCQRCH